MESWATIMGAFGIALSPENLFWCAVGVLLGTAVGVLPGIGPTSAMAILLPVTTLIPPVAGLIMLAGIYYGNAYGGSTTAILMNIPGATSSIPTCLDGYPLARQGRAGHALAIAAIGSFIAGTIGVVGLSLFMPLLANLAFALGVPEYFLFMMLAMTIVISLAGESLAKGMAAATLGLLTATVGIDTMSGQARFAFGSVALMNGLNFVAASIGLFAISEILINMEKGARGVVISKVGSLYPSLSEIIRMLPSMARGGALGFFLGILPGISPSVTGFMSYDMEKRLSRHPEKFGTGMMEGVAGPEACNNGCTSGGFIPLMAFGIPTDAALAMLLAAFMMYGLQPGPRMFQQHPEVIWGIIASMYIGNVMLLVLNLPLVGLWVKLLEVPYGILAPLILVISMIGAFGIRNNFFDLWTCLAFGLLGYVMKKLEVPPAPMVLGLVLGDSIEGLFRQSLSISSGDWSIFARGPVAQGLLVAICISAAIGILQRRRGPKTLVSEN